MKITGDTPKVKRFVSGMYSFDRAFENARGEIGFPLGQVTEIAGPTFCGKSTTVHGLAGLIAKSLNTNIVLADFEGFDPEYLTDLYDHAGFDGELRVLQKGDDEKTLDALVDHLKKKEFGFGILDSVGAISPLAELDGALGDANMGKRAKLMAQFSRKMLHLLLGAEFDPLVAPENPDGDEKPKKKKSPIVVGRSVTLLMVNHVHPILGKIPGTTTPGGETMKYLSAIRIRVKRKEEFPDQSYQIEGKVSKNRFGYKDRLFYLTLLSGKGIHLGLTAMFDCFLLGLAERGKVVKIGDKSHGRLKDMFDSAHEGKNECFDPFFELLKNAKPTDKEPTDDSIQELED